MPGAELLGGHSVRVIRLDLFRDPHIHLVARGVPPRYPSACSPPSSASYLPSLDFLAPPSPARYRWPSESTARPSYVGGGLTAPPPSRERNTLTNASLKLSTVA